MRVTRDDGFTLVELLVAVVILGVIAVPLAHALLGVFGRQDETAARMALSHDEQISAAHFARDVAAVGRRDQTAAMTASGNQPMLPSVQLAAAYDAGGVTCGDATTPTALVRLLSDRWDTSGASPVVRTDVVAYYLAGGELRRLKCAGSATPVSDIAIAHHVDPATAAVTCSSACGAATVPQRVTLAFTVTAPRADPHPITLTGQRRQM
ncbi:type II secretion system protein J [Actinokineospora soli]|uniref:Type II secretion system protein J n=1 Tax=Actinokineospora soli TaxID=1048753 RepID=A0ABW2TPF1_9PSEU